ncbi:cytochrome P450 [Cladorrhinum sp. PSN332]|nr:cytochrome P450 [Cladorrhinum sp. PSN332]
MSHYPSSQFAFPLFAHQALSMENPSYLQLVGALVAIGIASATWRLIRVRRFYKDLPKPPHSFLWGHLKLLGEISALFPPQTYYQAFYTEIAKRYDMPDVWYLDLWPLGPSLMMLGGPEAAMEITVVRSYPAHSFTDYYLTVFFGPNVITALNGAAWKNMHHMIGPSFAPMAVKGQVDTIIEHIDTYHEKLRALAATGEEFSMSDLTGAAIFDVVSSIIFGFSLFAQQQGSEFLQDFKLIFNLAHPFTMTLNPFKKLNLWWRMRAAKKRSDKLIYDKIQERHAALFGEEKFLQEEKRAKLCIMDRMIVQRIEELGPKVRDGLDPEYVKLVAPNLKAILAGGQGTTADTLCYALLLLSLHPEAMSRLREEHDGVFSPSYSETIQLLKSKPSKTSELEYTTAVIKETLRLFPIGFTFRQAPEDVTHLKTPSGSYPVRNQTICSSPQLTHFSPLHFPSPLVFLPDRFLPDYEPKHHRFAWRPFERGPRSCLGRELAMDEMVITLLLTARWFDFDLAVDRASLPKTPKVKHTDWDTKIGDLAFQIAGLSAGPRFGMPMRVRLTDRGKRQ